MYVLIAYVYIYIGYLNNNTSNPYTPPDYQGMHLKGEIFLHNYSLTTSVRLEPTQIYLSYYSKKEEDIQNRHKDLLLELHV